MAASSSGAQPPPPGGVSLSHLHSSSSLPLLPGFSSSLPLPHPLLDFGVRGAPVWPVQGSQPDGAAGQGWKMANARGRAPLFAASPIACLLPPSPSIHPWMFVESSYHTPSSSAGAAASVAASAGVAAQSAAALFKGRKRAAGSLTQGAASSSLLDAPASASDDRMEDEDDDEAVRDNPELDLLNSELTFHPAAAGASSTAAVASDPLTIPNQLLFYSRTLGSKRLRSALSSSSSSSSSSTPARPLTDRPSRGAEKSVREQEWAEENSNYIPEDLLKTIMEEDCSLAAQESREDLQGERLGVFETEQRRFVVCPSGPLMEEITVAEVIADAPINSRSPETLNLQPMCSIAIDSTIRQIVLGTMPDDEQNEGDEDEQPHPRANSVPLIFSRSCYTLHVHLLSSLSTKHQPARLIPLDTHGFSSPIVHMSANRSVPYEVAVLTQDGSVYLYALPDVTEELLHAIRLSKEAQINPIITQQVKRKLTHFPASSYAPPQTYFTGTTLTWGRILFAHTPRHLIVVREKAVVLVDVRAPYTSTSGERMKGSMPPPTPSRGRLLYLPPLALLPSQIYASSALRSPSQHRLFAASIHPQRPYELVVVTGEFVCVLDTRFTGSPGSGNGARPLLQWQHHHADDPPTGVEWVVFRGGEERDGGTDGGGGGGCLDCSERATYFITWNRKGNEVTLYSYSSNATSAAAPGAAASNGLTSPPPATASSSAAAYSSLGTSSLYAAANPLRLSSFVHTTSQALRHGSDASAGIVAPGGGANEASSLAGQLVGLKLLVSSLSPPKQRVYHLLQLSAYGSIISQAFQHRHEGNSRATSEEITPLTWVGKEEEAKGDGDEGEDDDRTSARSVRRPHASRPRIHPSPSRSPVSLASSPHSSPTSAASALSSPSALPPWMSAHEIKPYRAVNLKGLLDVCAENLVQPPASSAAAATKNNRAADSTQQRNATAVTRLTLSSYSSLLSHFLLSFHHHSSSIFTYLILPKTLGEVVDFVVDHQLLGEEAVQALEELGVTWQREQVEEVKKENGQRRAGRGRRNSRAASAAAASSSAPPRLPSQSLSCRSTRILSQLVQSTLHAFTYAFAPLPTPAQQDQRQQQEEQHEVWHVDEWARNMRAAMRADHARGDGSASDEDADDSNDLSSSNLPSPSFALYHHHLSLARFAEAESGNGEGVKREEGERDAEEESDAQSERFRKPTQQKPSKPVIATCTCISSSASSCCCSSICSAGSHCLLLHSTIYSSSPTLLHSGWPEPPRRREDDGDAGEGMRVEMHPYQGAGSHFTPRKPAPSAVDLSQDISFLMSQQASNDTSSENMMSMMPSQDQSTQRVTQEDGERLIGGDEHEEHKHQSIHFAPIPSSSSPMDLSGAAPEDPPPEAIPSDPYAFESLLQRMGDAWRNAEELGRYVERRRNERTRQRSSGGSGSRCSARMKQEDEEEDADLTALESELADSNTSAFMSDLISHGLAVDPTAAAAEMGEMAQDLRGTMMDEMEERAGRDED